MILIRGKAVQPCHRAPISCDPSSAIPGQDGKVVLRWRAPLVGGETAQSRRLCVVLGETTADHVEHGEVLLREHPPFVRSNPEQPCRLCVVLGHTMAGHVVRPEGVLRGSSVSTIRPRQQLYNPTGIFGR
jgi:hypothetical protein